ncbi:MAG: chemotaxis protein CheB [Bacteroidetes bacterium GWF2_40_14]|nr:MAG: chemotaxis protein CheB [Bacteroidetes bacterium GWF2_40_14]
MKPPKLISPLDVIDKPHELQPEHFPIVAIGASAGGLEALEQLLSAVPGNTGMAFVVIQHLDPTHKGMLPELLQRVTKMKVEQVKDRMVVKSDTVYVIPPNASMSILQGVLHLFEPAESRGLRLPIDFFMRSLADDLMEYAVGIVLSGMGSDGSVGMKAIKENNGIVMVQDPADAKFDSMPRNAMEAVVIDIVAPAKELPSKLIDLIKHSPVAKKSVETDVRDNSALEKIIILLRTVTGNDFSLYKKNTVYRRIERRMGVHKIEKISLYVNFLLENPKELEILLKELLIGVTSFFRDGAVWEKLKETIIPSIIANKPLGSQLRSWIVGCSTGEEAYSMAIVFREVVEKLNPNGGYSLQIFATDLDNEAIETARKGLYPLNIEADVSSKRLSRFFIASDEGYRVKAEIREMVVFAKHNIISHPPFTKIDILSCRNLLIYMDVELQKKLLGLFYYSIIPEGYMVLGSAETLGLQSTTFSQVDAKLKIYNRSFPSVSPESYDFPSSFSRSRPVVDKNDYQVPVNKTQNIQTLADQLLLQNFSPPGVLVNDKGDIIYISGHTGKYLEPAVGKANMNIFAMLREGLRNEFSSAFRKAISKKELVVVHNIKVGTNGGSQIINLSIQWIDKPDQLNGMLMIIFTDVTKLSSLMDLDKKAGKALQTVRQAEMEKELQLLREELQNTMEEMQTSQEEQKSTNEELQSTNEELQSSNEELTTSKEEMQSLNEELQTVNAELQTKIDDFTNVSNDMKNLLNSTDIATLFLDKNLNIRRFTTQATSIFKLIKSDIGRPLTDQVSDLVYPELVSDAKGVLKSLVFVQKQVPTKDGRWFSIRIMPYRTFDDRIDGLVITFVNISDIKRIELQLQERVQMFNLILEASSDIIIKLSPEWDITEFNAEAEKFFGLKSQSALNQNFIKLFVPEQEQKRVELQMNKQLKDTQGGIFKMQMKGADGTLSDVEWTAKRLFNDNNTIAGMIIINKKISKS